MQHHGSAGAGGRKAHIIVFGNQKGGSGKSTAAMHVIVGLLRLGYNVASLDLDSTQGTLTSYLRNRWSWIEQTGEYQPSPHHVLLDRLEPDDRLIDFEEEEWRVNQVMAELSPGHDFIVVDTPGSSSFVNILGHSWADTLVTPMNDSFIDVDVLARLEPDSGRMLRPSLYSQMVMDIRNRREAEGRRLDWVVMRNRLSPIEAMNKRAMTDALARLAPQLGFRQAQGFSERVIFRELFLKGLTLLDLKESGEAKITLSNLAARQEVRKLIRDILPDRAVSTMALLKTA